MFFLFMLASIEIWTNMNYLIYSLIRLMCFSLILLPDSEITNKFQCEDYFVLFTLVNENLVFYKSHIGFYVVWRYVIAMGLILNYLCHRLSNNIKWNVGSEIESKPIFLRYWQSISKLASFIWPSNNVRLQLCLAACGVLLILGRVTALLAPIYGKKVGKFLFYFMSNCKD